MSAPHLAVLVRAGPTFINGELGERPGGEPRPVLAIAPVWMADEEAPPADYQ